jgi:hypothetical protein
MKNKQDITVFVPERRRRSMLVTPSEAKRLGHVRAYAYVRAKSAGIIRAYAYVRAKSTGIIRAYAYVRAKSTGIIRTYAYVRANPAGIIRTYAYARIESGVTLSIHNNIIKTKQLELKIKGENEIIVHDVVGTKKIEI